MVAVMAEPANEKLINRKQAAEMLGVCEKTLWTNTSPRGPIPAVKIGKAVRYSPTLLREFIRQSCGAALPTQSPPDN